MIDDELLHKWVNKNLTADELKQFKLRPEYESLKELYDHTEQLAAPAFDEEAMLSDILRQKKKIKPLPNRGKTIALSSWAKYGVAASLLLLVVWFFLPREQPVSFEIAQGQKAESALPDGSSFVLNADSKLSFFREDWENDRSLKLEGEAFFEVKKGATFRVETPNGVVQVLGTQFNVKSRGNTIEVKCKTGKVAVTSVSGKTLKELNPSDAVRIADGKIVEAWKLADANQVDSWTAGIFRFESATLERVLAELSRQFEVDFDTKGVDTSERLTCNFQNNNLEAALKTTVVTLGIQYEIKDNATVVLTK